MMLLYKRILYLLARIIVKPDDNTVLFEAFQGRFVTCSPKALYLEMIDNPKYKNFTLIWSLRNTNRPDIIKNNNTEVVKFESFAYYKALARAKYWIFNSNPRPFLKPKANQVFVQTWHGTPLKKIGCDVNLKGNAMTKLPQIRRLYEIESKNISYMVSPSDYCTKRFISAFDLERVGKADRVLTIGYPRNDFLFKYTENQCKDIRNKLGIPDGKKIILYAPTFRDNEYSAKEGFRLTQYMDFEKAKEAWGDKAVILFRAHYFISQKLDVSAYSDFVFDVSKVEDINELYVISDLLITDYSSVFFDYANLRRPIIFFMKDFEVYKHEVRDFYFDMEELPGPIVRDDNDLYNKVNGLLEQFVPDDKYIQFCKKYNSLDSADTSRKVLEQIIK